VLLSVKFRRVFQPSCYEEVDVLTIPLPQGRSQGRKGRNSGKAKALITISY